MCGFGDKVAHHPRAHEEERRIPTADRTFPTTRRTEDPSPLHLAFDWSCEMQTRTRRSISSEWELLIFLWRSFPLSRSLARSLPLSGALGWIMRERSTNEWTRGSSGPPEDNALIRHVVISIPPFSCSPSTCGQPTANARSTWCGIRQPPHRFQPQPLHRTLLPKPGPCRYTTHRPITPHRRKCPWLRDTLQTRWWCISRCTIRTPTNNHHTRDTLPSHTNHNPISICPLICHRHPWSRKERIITPPRPPPRSPPPITIHLPCSRIQGRCSRHGISRRPWSIRDPRRAACSPETWSAVCAWVPSSWPARRITWACGLSCRIWACARKGIFGQFSFVSQTPSPLDGFRRPAFFAPRRSESLADPGIDPTGSRWILWMWAPPARRNRSTTAPPRCWLRSFPTRSPSTAPKSFPEWSRAQIWASALPCKGSKSPSERTAHVKTSGRRKKTMMTRERTCSVYVQTSSPVLLLSLVFKGKNMELDRGHGDWGFTISKSGKKNQNKNGRRRVRSTTCDILHGQALVRMISKQEGRLSFSVCYIFILFVSLTLRRNYIMFFHSMTYTYHYHSRYLNEWFACVWAHSLFLKCHNDSFGHVNEPNGWWMMNCTTCLSCRDLQSAIMNIASPLLM